MALLNQEHVDRFFANGGSKQLLSALGKSQRFADALSTDVGQELLKDAAQNAEGLLEKIINEEADEKDRADYRAYKRILLDWAGRISARDKQLTAVVEKINGTRRSQPV